MDIYTLLDRLKDYGIKLAPAGNGSGDLICFHNEIKNSEYFTYSPKEKTLFIYTDKYKTISSKISLKDFELVLTILKANNNESIEVENSEEEVEEIEVVETEEEREDRLLKEEFGDLYLIENEEDE